MISIEDILILDEGVRLHPYEDTVGKTTIGIGRNLDDVGISEDEAKYLLSNDLKQVRHELNNNQTLCVIYKSLSPYRQIVLESMLFNLGLNRLLGFKLFISALARSDYSAAAKEMLDSKWARQVGARAFRLASVMQENSLSAYDRVLN